MAKFGKNSIRLLLVLIFLVPCCFSGCSSGGDDATSEDELSTAFNFTITAYESQTVETVNTGLKTAAVVVGSATSPILRGELLARNTDTGEEQTFSWTATFNEDTWELESTKTLVLDPGDYDFSLLLEEGNQQYAGEAIHGIIDGTNDVPLVIRPIIGQSVANVSVVASLADFKFQYDPDELNGFTDPQFGIIVDADNEQIFKVNPETGISDNYVNLASGQHSLNLKLYDGQFQRGKSDGVTEVNVVPGDNIVMDLVPLHGETIFSLTEEGGTADFTFNIPAEVVDEAGGVNNLEVIFALVDSNGTLCEDSLNLISSGDDYTVDVTCPDIQPGTATISLTFNDISENEQIAQWAETVDLNTEQNTLTCDIEIRRRAIITGSLLAVLGVNVRDENYSYVEGAVVSVNGEEVGITGSGAFGTQGYLKLYLVKGDYTVRAEFDSLYGESVISLSALDVENVEVVLKESNIIYQENFDTVPQFTTSPDFRPQDGDIATWDNNQNNYRVYLKEHHPPLWKFAITPHFSTIQNQSFEVKFDLRYAKSSWGMGMHILFVNGDVPAYSDGIAYSAGIQMDLADHHCCDPDSRGRLRTSDCKNYFDRTLRLDTSTWYTLSLKYNHDAGTASLLLLNRDTQEVFFEQNDVTFNPGAFDAIAFGHTTAWYDGTDAEMYIDNITVSNGSDS